MSLAGTCIGLSFDSFLVCFALGPFIADRRRRIALAGAFAALDGAATIAAGYGAAGAVAFFCAAALVIAAERSWAKPSRLPLALVPLLMSLDNLTLSRGPSDAVVDALASGAAAALGFGAAALAARRLGSPRRATPAGAMTSPWA